MPNQYSKLTPENLKIKMTRKKNPATTWTQLAREFGYNTQYTRRSGPRAGQVEHRAPASFMRKVSSLLASHK